MKKILLSLILVIALCPNAGSQTRTCIVVNTNEVAIHTRLWERMSRLIAMLEKDIAFYSQFEANNPTVREQLKPLRDFNRKCPPFILNAIRKETRVISDEYNTPGVSVYVDEPNLDCTSIVNKSIEVAERIDDMDIRMDKLFEAELKSSKN